MIFGSLSSSLIRRRSRTSKTHREEAEKPRKPPTAGPVLVSADLESVGAPCPGPMRARRTAPSSTFAASPLVRVGEWAATAFPLKGSRSREGDVP
jgi:hypothetical protein